MVVTSDEITALLGPVDEALHADILRTGASLEELNEAWAWVSNDEAMINAGHPLPKGRVLQLVDLLIADEDAEK